MVKITKIIKITVVNGILNMKSKMEVGNRGDNHRRNMTETREKLKRPSLQKHDNEKRTLK